MIVVLLSILFLTGIAVLVYKARKIELPKDVKASGIERIFQKMALYCYGFLQKDNELNKRWNRLSGRHTKGIASNQVLMDLKALEPGKAIQEMQKQYYVRKIRLLLMIMTIGFFMTIVIWTSQIVNQPIRDGIYLDRYSFGEGDQQIALTASLDNGETQEVTVTVPERQYTEEALEGFYEEMLPLLEQTILGENTEPDAIRHDLQFVNRIGSYPFQLRYSLDSYEYVDIHGELLDGPEDMKEEVRLRWEKTLEQGVMTNITVKASYQNFIREYTIPICVLPKSRTNQEIFQLALERLLHQADEDTKTEEYMTLPDRVEEQQITWQAQNSQFPILFFIMIWLCVIVSFYGKDKDLHDKVKKREQQMLSDYPEIISKVTLLTGAGMTVRNAFYRIVREYMEKRKHGYQMHYAYEEMKLAVYEMESGVSEVQAYENFGKRCKLKQYMKFTALLSQNLRKSSSGIFALLQEESREAFEIRKSIARKLGEEAGTKMLFPMMLMLGIIMVIIFYPAFASYA